MFNEVSKTMMTTISAAHDTEILHINTFNMNLSQKLHDILQLVHQSIYYIFAAFNVNVTDTLITLDKNYDEKVRDEGIFLLFISQSVT